jgi:hypothetical protein
VSELEADLAFPYATHAGDDNPAWILTHEIVHGITNKRLKLGEYLFSTNEPRVRRTRDDPVHGI